MSGRGTLVMISVSGGEVQVQEEREGVGTNQTHYIAQH